MNTPSKNSMRLNRLASVVVILFTLCLLTGGVSEAGDKGNFAYFGDVTGTKTCGDWGADMSLLCTADGATEVSNVGGTGTQDFTLKIFPSSFDSMGYPTVLTGVGRAISHKKGGDLYVDFVLHEEVGQQSPAAFSGTYVIDGGTGRYKRSQGSGIITGEEDFSNGSFRNHYEGTLILKEAGPKEK